MTPALFMGLFVTATGIFMIPISGLLIRGAVSGHPGLTMSTLFAPA